MDTSPFAKLRAGGVVLAFALCAAPAIAQDEQEEGAPDRESTILVYGNDDCPPSTDDNVVVCARRPEEERYRIPRNLRNANEVPEQSWASRVESLEEASRHGRPNSCSVDGSYGQTGCMAAAIRQWQAERRARPSRGY
jgi:hypothetical protein